MKNKTLKYGAVMGLVGALSACSGPHSTNTEESITQESNHKTTTVAALKTNTEQYESQKVKLTNGVPTSLECYTVNASTLCNLILKEDEYEISASFCENNSPAMAMKAASIIESAINQNKRIVVYGVYKKGSTSSFWETPDTFYVYTLQTNNFSLDQEFNMCGRIIETKSEGEKKI
ncbi:hypothetical protein HY643_02045 [Candidatus Woesearchaeota archaeon]|nr:hypothetical protein [Candidatus Woesearchaeota archaeon]